MISKFLKKDQKFEKNLFKILNFCKKIDYN